MPTVEDIPRERLIEGNPGNILLTVNGGDSRGGIFNSSMSNIEGRHEVSSTGEARLNSPIPHIF
jgi:hypothetical protein